MTPTNDAPVTVERRYLSDRFKWAAPGDRQHDVWIVRFDDNDVRDMVFEGPEAEAEAWAAWERHAPGYNMRVFRLAALASVPAGDGVEAFARSQADQWLEDMQTPSLGAKHVSLMAMARNCIAYGAALARPRAAVEPVQDRASGIEAFLAAILERSPNGETVEVKYHPDGAWSVFDGPRAAVGEREAEERIAVAEGAMWQALQDKGSLSDLIDWIIASLGHMSDGLHDTKSVWADYGKRLHRSAAEKHEALKLAALQSPPAKVER